MFKVLNRKREQVDILENPISPVITNELGGIGELTFSVPATYKHLELEGYIIVENDCEYVIKEIVTHGMNRQVMCILNVEEIIGMAHATFYSKENTIDETMRIILNGTKWRHENKSTNTEKRNLYGTVTNSYNMLQLMTTVFGVEFEFDTHRKVVTILDKVGSDKGVYFTNDLNLRQLNQDTHSHKFITRLIPIGKDGLLIDEVNGGKQWIANHKYSDKEIYGIWQSSNIEDPNILKRDGERFLEEMCIPYETYEVVIRDLYQLADNENFEYELGDIVTIIDSVTETRIQQRVIKKTRNLQDPNQDTINIANKDQTFQDYYKRLQVIADMTESVVNQDGSINGDAIGSVPSDKIEGDISIDKIVGDIVADFVKADSIEANHIKANQIQTRHLTADSITSGHIQADSIDAKHIKAGTIVSEHIQAGVIQAGHIQAGSITAGSGIIADGAIGSAQISKLDANKIEAGTIDTSKVTVAGANSNLLIRGNRLQVFDGIGSNQVERVSLGDVNNDGTVYGFRVRGKDGKTVLLDENGVKSEGITDGSITNDKISGEANIDGAKLNINSVVTKINGATTSILGTKIEVGGTNLSAKLSQQDTTIEGHTEKLSTQQSSITANTNAIKLKVDEQTYTSDKANMTSTLNKHTSEIATMKGQIALKVEQTDINNAIADEGRRTDTKINTAKSEIKLETDQIKSSVSSVAQEVKTVDGKVVGIDSRLKTAEQKITDEAITSTVKKTSYTKAETDGKITSTVDEAKTEIKQTTDSITNEVFNLTEGHSKLTQKVDGFEFKVENTGGKQLISDSLLKQNWTYWATHGYMPNGSINGMVYIQNKSDNPDWVPPNVNVGVIRCTDGHFQSGFEVGLQTRWVSVQPNMEHTLTFFYACHRGRPYVTIRNAHSGGWISHEGLSAISGGSSFDKWGYHTITFKASNTDAVKVEFGVDENYGDCWAWFAKPMLVEGGVGQKHSSKDDELYDGVTTIDSQGIKVTHSNGDFTQMTSQGLKRHRSNGDAKGDYHYLTQYIGFSGQDTVWVQLKDDFKGKQFTAYSVISDTWEGSWNHGEPWVVQRFVTYVETDKIDYANARVPVLTYRIDKNYSTGAHRKMPCAGILLVVG